MKYSSYLSLVCLLIIFFICHTIFFIFNYKIEGYESLNLKENAIDLPIIFPFQCKNFCGPTNTCAITGETCSNDYDCQGCESIPYHKPPKVMPYYKELSHDNEQMDYVYVGAKNNLTPIYPSGNEEWIYGFNEAMKLYNRRETYNSPLTDFEKKIVSDYPITMSTTGQYYNTTASAYNQHFI